MRFAATAKSLQSCPTLCDPRESSPPRLSCPWNSPGKNTGVGLPFPSPMHESKKWKWSCSVISDPQWPHGLQPTRLLHPWDFPGKSTGVGCHCLLCLWGLHHPNTKTRQKHHTQKGNYQPLSLGLSLAQMVRNMPVERGTWVWSLCQEDTLEKGMVTHFSILAWRIPWTEEPGGLQSMGSQRVRHDWVINIFTSHHWWIY